MKNNNNEFTFVFIGYQFGVPLWNLGESTYSEQTLLKCGYALPQKRGMTKKERKDYFRYLKIKKKVK